MQCLIVNYSQKHSSLVLTADRLYPDHMLCSEFSISCGNAPSHCPYQNQVTTWNIRPHGKPFIKLLTLSDPVCQVFCVLNVNFYSLDFFPLGFARLRINCLFQGKAEEVKLSGKVNSEDSWGKIKYW